MQRNFYFVYTDESFYDDTEIVGLLSVFVEEDYFSYTYQAHTLAVI